MKIFYAVSLIALSAGLTACNRAEAPAPVAATTAQASAQTVTTVVNGKRFILSTTPTATLQAGVARQYGITQSNDTILVLVSVTDTAGNPVSPGLAQVAVYAGIAPDAPTEIAMKPVQVEGFSNLVGQLTVKPPAKLTLRMEVNEGGSHTSQSFTRDVLPR